MIITKVEEEGTFLCCLLLINGSVVPGHRTTVLRLRQMQVKSRSERSSSFHGLERAGERLRAMTAAAPPELTRHNFINLWAITHGIRLPLPSTFLNQRTTHCKHELPSRAYLKSFQGNYSRFLQSHFKMSTSLDQLKATGTVSRRKFYPS